MISVAVCDGDVGFLYKFSDMVLNKMGDDLGRLDQFSSSEELADSKEKYDMIFLDIDTFESKDDIEKQYEEKEPLLIFLTDRNSRLFNILNTTNAFGCIRKGSMLSTDFDAVIEKYYKSEQQNRFLTVAFKRQVSYVKYSDILYIERANNRLVIHTQTESYQERIALSRLFEVLKGYGFLRTHMGYIVNLNYVSSIESNEAVLFNNKRIPISRNHLKAVKLAFGKRREITRKY